MDRHPRRRGLVAQVAEPAGLVAGEVLRDVAAGGEPDGVLVAGPPGRRLDPDAVEVGLAVVGVEAPALEHARRARVVLGGARPGSRPPGPAATDGDAGISRTSPPTTPPPA